MARIIETIIKTEANETERVHEIELTIQNEFISKYQFKDLVQYGYNFYFIDYSRPGTFTFPFTFPPFHKSYDKQFLGNFLDRITQLFNEFGIDPDKHLDPLLFIVNSYQIKEWERQKENYLKNRDRVNGKLLVGLLRMPFAEITRDNIKEHLEQDYEEEYLSAYLGVVSGKPESTFQVNGRVDLGLVNDVIWKKLVDKVKYENNLKIKLEQGQELLFSRNIKLKLHYEGLQKGVKALMPESEIQNKQLVEHLICHLIEKEKQSNTELYRLLNKQRNSNDVTKNVFHADKHSRELTNCTYDTNKDSHNQILKRLSILICNYLHEEGLFLKPKRNGSISSKQKQFLYPFFLFLGLILRNDRSLRPYETIEELTEQIEMFRKNIALNPIYSEKKLDEAFKPR